MRIWPAFLFVAAAFGQGEFHVAGTVINARTSEPVRGALVSVDLLPTGPNMPAKSAVALSGATGTFRVEGIPEGKYYLRAEKPGWSMSSVSLNSFDLGPSVEKLVVQLDPLSTIRGRVTDQEGEPVAGAAVRLFRSEFEDGRHVITRAQSVNTDGLGNYRLSDIATGKYYLLAAGRGGDTSVVVGETAPAADAHENFAPVYFGGTADRESAADLVAAGQEMEADFHVSMRPAYRVRGRLRNAKQYQSVQIEVLRGGEDVSAARARVDSSTGQFEVQDAVPGSYVLRATQRLGSDTVRGEAAVEVGEQDIDGIEIALAPPVAVVIKTQVQERERPNWCGGYLLGSDWSKLDVERTQDGTTKVKVFPGRYRLRFACPGGYMASAMAGNVDLLPSRILEVTAGTPTVEIVASMEGGTVTGAAEAGFVVLVPVGGVEAEMIPVFGGVYAFYGVAPGDYELYLLRTFGWLEYRDPAVMRKLGRGVPVRVDKGSTVTVDLKEALR